MLQQKCNLLFASTKIFVVSSSRRKSENVLREIIKVGCSSYVNNTSEDLATNNECLENQESWVKRIVLSPVPCAANHVRSANKNKIQYDNYLLLVSYCGKGYHGSQYLGNPLIPTISGELMCAMRKADLRSNTAKSRTFPVVSRTDKGVSAVRLALTTQLKKAGSEAIRSQLNEHLPDCIRVMDARVVRVNFNLRSQCENRSYSYTTPSFAFAHVTEIMNEQYRITPEMLAEVKSVLKIFEGSHNFKNFTKIRDVKLKPAVFVRHIRTMSVSEPFIYEGIEFLRINIKGNSFMLYQIRRMVAFAMAVCKGVVSKKNLNDAFSKKSMHVPSAPPIGLVMEGAHFNDSVNWDHVEEEIEEFRRKYIQSHILETEKKEKSMLRWLSNLFTHDFTLLKFFPRDWKPERTGISAAMKLIDRNKIQ